VQSLLLVRLELGLAVRVDVVRSLDLDLLVQLGPFHGIGGPGHLHIRFVSLRMPFKTDLVFLMHETVHLELFEFLLVLLMLLSPALLLQLDSLK